jgi:peptide/nickel transport system substrate-binding protein
MTWQFGRRGLLAGACAILGRGAQATTTRTLGVGIASDPVTLDPAFAGSFFENAVLYNLHETLLVAAPDGGLLPGLAERCEAPDPLTLRLALRSGLTFHDGTVLDAEAVRFNLARYLDPKTGSIRRSDLGPIARVAATGPLDVEITLVEPYAALPSILAGRAGMMVSPAALARLGPDFAAQAVGCGAWQLEHWTKNSDLVLKAFPGYWRGADHGFSTLSFRPIADETARLANLRSGTLGLIDAVPPQFAAPLAAEPGFRVAQTPSIGFSAFSFNCTRPPFGDRRVRQAFVASIDPDVLERIVYFGTGRVAHGPLSPAVAWAFDTDFMPPRRDLERARRLLAEASLATPVPVTITVTNAPLMVRTAEVLQAQARDAGFAPTLRQIDATSLLATLRARDFDLCMSPWSGRYDPDGNMFGWLTEGSPFNFSGYASETMTGLLRQARHATDRAERARLYHMAQALSAEDAPILFLHFDAIIQAATAKLRWAQYSDGVFRLYDARLG